LPSAGLTLAGLACSAAGLPASPADAFELGDAGLTIGVTPTISSDYLFRGVSQTRNRPTVQGTIDVQHTTGFYVGAFASYFDTNLSRGECFGSQKICAARAMVFLSRTF
jgi:uncharacterized protein (TIGR02001 family)